MTRREYETAALASQSEPLLSLWRLPMRPRAHGVDPLASRAPGWLSGAGWRERWLDRPEAGMPPARPLPLP